MCESQPRRSGKLFWIIFLILLPLILWLAAPIRCGMSGYPSDPKIRSKAATKDIQVGIGHYRTEFNRWPDEAGLVNSESAPVKVRGRLLEALMGSSPRSMRFVDLSVAKPGRSGLAMEDGVPAWHDPWGTCFFLMADINRDNRIANPELMAGAVTPSKISSKAPKFLPVSTAVFSAGPDRDPNTWADNIPSWR